jgi:DNA-binding GntR family transcriptional regulator
MAAPLDAVARRIAVEMGRSDRPKYLRVFEAFARAIRDGLFKPGERLPPEATLSSRLPVSLGTIQKALGRLADSGLVIRRRKAGTFVADRRSQAAAFVYRFRDPESGRLLVPFVRALAVVEDRSPGPWQEHLHARRCVRLDRLLWVEQDPPAFSSVFFPLEHGKFLLEVPLEQLHGSSTHRLMVEHFSLPTLRVEHRIGCRKLSDEACRHLMIPRGTVGTVWDVSDFSVGDRATLFQRLQLPPGHRPVELAETFAGRSPRLRSSREEVSVMSDHHAAASALHTPRGPGQVHRPGRRP